MGFGGLRAWVWERERMRTGVVLHGALGYCLCEGNIDGWIGGLCEDAEAGRTAQLASRVLLRYADPTRCVCQCL